MHETSQVSAEFGLREGPGRGARAALPEVGELRNQRGPERHEYVARARDGRGLPTAVHHSGVEPEQQNRWYAVRSLFHVPGEADSGYEERIALGQAAALDDALARAATEAAEYAEFAGVTHVSG